MNLHHQIKKHRSSLNISQEQLAEEIYVSRQTISNWETGKNYPDIRSLLLLCGFFGTTLDELVKGDLEIMKKEIDSNEIGELKRASAILSGLLVVLILSAAPLLFFLKAAGIVIWLTIGLVTAFAKLRLGKVKKRNDIQTFKEITAFMNGETLDNITKAQEVGKRNYQQFIYGFCVSIITFITVVFIGKLLEFFAS